MLQAHLLLTSKSAFVGHDKQFEDEEPEHVKQVEWHKAHWVPVQ